MLIPTEKYLTPHNIFKEQTFEEYCSRIPEFYFKKEVPEDVKRNFEIVEQLLAHSYYEYRFIDEAYAKALTTFEMAMKIRLKDFRPHAKSMTFYPLIKTLTKLKLFETEVAYLEHLEFMRNHYSHPENHNYGGILFWHRIEPVSRMINEMYEDVNLRLERKKSAQRLTYELQKGGLDKAVVMEIQGIPKILHSLKLLFINNKHNPCTYLFACTPLFNLQEDEGSIYTPFVFKAKLTNPTIIDNSLMGESFTAKHKVTFKTIHSYPELLPTFEAWEREYLRKSDFTRFRYEASNLHIPEFFIPEIQEFQRM